MTTAETWGVSKTWDFLFQYSYKPNPSTSSHVISFHIYINAIRSNIFLDIIPRSRCLRAFPSYTRRQHLKHNISLLQIEFKVMLPYPQEPPVQVYSNPSKVILKLRVSEGVYLSTLITGLNDPLGPRAPYRVEDLESHCELLRCLDFS